MGVEIPPWQVAILGLSGPLKSNGSLCCCIVAEPIEMSLGADLYASKDHVLDRGQGGRNPFAYV